MGDWTDSSRDRGRAPGELRDAFSRMGPLFIGPGLVPISVGQVLLRHSRSKPIDASKKFLFDVAFSATSIPSGQSLAGVIEQMISEVERVVTLLLPELV